MDKVVQHKIQNDPQRNGCGIESLAFNEGFLVNEGVLSNPDDQLNECSR